MKTAWPYSPLECSQTAQGYMGNCLKAFVLYLWPYLRPPTSEQSANSDELLHSISAIFDNSDGHVVNPRRPVHCNCFTLAYFALKTSPVGGV